jgi:hypothetical protein
VIIEIPNGVTNKKRAQKNKQTKESHSHSSRYLGTVGLILKTAIKYIDSNFVKYKFWVFTQFFIQRRKLHIQRFIGRDYPISQMVGPTATLFLNHLT